MVLKMLMFWPFFYTPSDKGGRRDKPGSEVFRAFFWTPFLTQSYRPTSSNTTLCDPAVFGGPETVIKIIPIFQTVLDEATEPWGIKVERVEM